MKQNVGTADRLIRGFVVAPGALVWAALVGWTTVWGIVALVVAGIMLITAAVGFCPLYAVLGIDTARRSRAAHV
jgi:hypothetical protein